MHRLGAAHRLANIPDHLLAFSPGIRTRDDGELGDASGEISLDPQPDAAQWQLHRGDNLVASVETREGQPLRLRATRGGAYVLTMHEPGNDGVVGWARISIPQFVRIVAPVEAVAPNLTELGVPEAQRQAVWDAIIAVARPVCHHILRPANVRLIWPADQLPAFFSDHPIPGDGEALLSPVEGYTHNTADGPRQAYQVPTTVMLTSPVSTLCSAADFMDRMRALAAELSADPRVAMLPLQVLFPQFMVEPEEGAAARHGNEPAWGFDASFSALDIGIARVGLGAFNFAGSRTAEGHGTDVDQALAALACTTDAAGARASRIDWADPVSAPFRRFVELAGRQVGVFVARATLRMIGAQVEADGHVTVADGNDVVISGILAPAPHDPLQDVLGLHRPPERAFDQLSGDLEHQQARADAAGSPSNRLPEVATRWVDLVALEQAGIRTERTMPGATSAYDALTGVVTDASVTFVDGTLGLLSSAYGPYELRPGDRDTAIGTERAPVYGGTERPEGRPADDIIGVLQRDLHAIGIKLGLPTPTAPAAQEYNGFYGYRRFVEGNAKYDGDLGEAPTTIVDRRGEDLLAHLRTEIMRGHSEWAVREFQIASSYPNRVAEKIGAGAHYAERLHVVDRAAGPRANETRNSAHRSAVANPDEAERVQAPASPAALPSGVNGRLTILGGDQLRRWRFQRRRPQITVIAGTQITGDRGGPFIPPNNRNIGQNLDRLDEFPDTAYRMYVFDRSGYFGAGPEHAVLGDYSTYRQWGGTRASSAHAVTRITLAHTVGALAPQPEADFHSAYRVVMATSQAETLGYYDGLNGYDDGVFSYPLFHHTLTLTGRGNQTSRPGQMAGFVRWLQDPPEALLQAVFPNAGGNAPNHPAPYPADQAEVDDLRTNMRNRFHAVFNEAFGFFGVGASPTNATPLQGLITVAGLVGGTTPAGNAVNMRVVWPGADANGLRQQALYQAYQQWFRTWPWFYRFAAALRQNQTLRTLLFAYALDWTQNWLGAAARRDIRTESGRAVYVRIAVRGSAYFSANQAREAVNTARLANANVDEAQAILAAINQEATRRNQAAREATDPRIAEREEAARNALQGLSGTVGTTIGYNSPDPEIGRLRGNGQSNDIYERVRNDILRRLIAG